MPLYLAPHYVLRIRYCFPITSANGSQIKGILRFYENTVVRTAACLPVYLRSLIAISLPSRSLRSNRGITLSIPRIKTNTGARAFSSCAPSLWNNLPLSVRSATSVATFRRRPQNIPFRLGLPPPPVDTGVPTCLLMLRNDFNDFAFEHRSSCCATEPGCAGDIGSIEIWLIDWY